MAAIKLTAMQRGIIRTIWQEPNAATEGERMGSIEKHLGSAAWFSRGWCRLHFGPPGARTVIPATKSPEAIRRDNARRCSPYQYRATNTAVNPGMNYLSDLIIRPGIQKLFRPLLLYRGAMSPGHAHRFWNLVLLMMAAECETLADGFKILHNASFAQLCGPVRPPGKPHLASFFGRLWSSPDVTALVPGLTEYVKSVGLGPCRLQPVELESDRQFVAPWRISNHLDHDAKAERPETGIRQLYYPFMAHDPERKDDGHKIVMLVNQMVPQWLPDPIRADACQELVVGLLSGDVPAGQAHDWVQKYVRKMYVMYPNLGNPMFRQTHQVRSLDQTRTRDGTAISYTEHI